MPTVLVWQTLAGTMRTRNDNGHPIFAALYDWLGGAAERGWMGRRRSRLLAEASGSVLEIGGGTGANLAHYREAAYVVVAEPDPFMRGKLRRKLGAARVPVEVSEAGAEALPFSDGSFDAVVSTLVLCTVPDQGVALAEIRRVLRPGGRLLFIEHVRGEGDGGRVAVGRKETWSSPAATRTGIPRTRSGRRGSRSWRSNVSYLPGLSPPSCRTFRARRSCPRAGEGRGAAVLRSTLS